jgi:hypothetical protein
MKTTVITLALAAFAVTACDQKLVEHPIPPVPEQPHGGSQKKIPVSSKQTYSPSEDSVLPPPTVHHFTGEVFVLRRFTVPTADGIHGFSVGKKVTVVREDGDYYIVTDGVAEGKAPKESITDKQELVKISVVKVALPQAAPKTQSEIQASNVASQKLLDKAESDRKRGQIQNFQTALQNMNSRIKVAQDERRSKGYPADGGSRHNEGHRNSHHVEASLGSDASQIENLIAERALLENQLRSVK